MGRQKKIIHCIGPPTTVIFYVLGKSVLEQAAFCATVNHVGNLKHRNIFMKILTLLHVVEVPRSGILR